MTEQEWDTGEGEEAEGTEHRAGAAREVGGKLGGSEAERKGSVETVSKAAVRSVRARTNLAAWSAPQPKPGGLLAAE